MRGKPKVPIRLWIGSLFVQAALIPLFPMDALLAAAYLPPSASIRNAPIPNLRSMALENLEASSARPAPIFQDERKPNERALAYIHEQSGLHFDPDLVVHLDPLIPDIEALRQPFGNHATPIHRYQPDPSYVTSIG